MQLLICKHSVLKVEKSFEAIYSFKQQQKKHLKRKLELIFFFLILVLLVRTRSLGSRFKICRQKSTLWSRKTLRPLFNSRRKQNRTENIFTQQVKAEPAKDDYSCSYVTANSAYVSYGQLNAFYSVCKNPVLLAYINCKCSKISETEPYRNLSHIITPCSVKLLKVFLHMYLWAIVLSIPVKR